MNILIVAPKYTVRLGDYYAFPLGLAYISAALKKHNFSVYCLNLSHHEIIEPVLTEYILSYNIDIVCVGGLSLDFGKIEHILNHARATRTGIKTILGGGIITADPDPIFRLLKVDYGVIGEGEETIVELVKTIIDGGDLQDIQGIMYRNLNGETVKNQPRESIRDLNTIPFPDLDGFGASQYLEYQMSNDQYDLSTFDTPRYLPIISSRSCPYSCTFCFHPLGTKYRQRSISDFFKELDYLIEKYDINYAGIYDELFSNDRKRIISFCQEMKKRNIKWMTQLRVDKVDEEMLEILRDSGLFFVSYGIESADDGILKSMKKQITVKQIENTLALTARMKIGTQGNLIFGDSEETWETAMRSLKWFRNHREYNLGLIAVEVYPGTPLYLRAIESKIIKDRDSYLSNTGRGRINISKLTSKEYNTLMQILWDTSAKTYMQMRAKLVRMKKIASDVTKGDIYILETICPFCKTHNIYPRFNIPGTNRFMGLLLQCKHCYRQHAVYIQSRLYLIIMLCLPRTVRHRLIKAWPSLAIVKKKIMTWVKR